MERDDWEVDMKMRPHVFALCWANIRIEKKLNIITRTEGGQFLTEVLQHYNGTMETMTELLDLEYSLLKWRK